MTLLSIANLTFGYGDELLLDGVNLTLDRGQRMGLVGRNGCGKSTLLKMIAGLTNHKPLSGQVQLARGVTVGYLAQHFELNLNATVFDEARSVFADADALRAQLDELTHLMGETEGDELQEVLDKYADIEHRLDARGGDQVDHLIGEALHGVGLTDETFGVRVGDCSGGQKGRLALAKLMLSAPDLMLLDEPTNHLDIEGRQWLEQTLVAHPGAVIVISHDRWLLDASVDRICELERGQLVTYPGNYSKFRELRAERRLAQQRMFEKQQTKIKQEQAFIDRYRAGQRAKQAQGREKRLERYKRDETIERPVELDEVSIKFGAASRAPDIILEATGLGVEYETRRLFADVDITIKRGETVGVMGPNGSGKTTLVRTLLGELDNHVGKVKRPESLQIAYFRQTQEAIDLTLTVVDFLRPFVGRSEQAARDLAGAFLFTGIEQDKPLSVLSGGERARAVLASLVAKGPNVLVLDEPTNHLDIPSSERLEEALRRYTQPPAKYGLARGQEGTLILITHDRALLDVLAQRLIVFDGHGRVRDLPMGYRAYLQLPAAPPPSAAKPVATKASASPASSSAAAGRGGKASPMMKLSTAELEARIVAVESQLAEIDTQLADPLVYRDGEKVRALRAQRDALKAQLEPLESAWASRT